MRPAVEHGTGMLTGQIGLRGGRSGVHAPMLGVGSWLDHLSFDLFWERQPTKP